MQRREFITLLGASAAAWPLAVRAQQSTMPRIGFLNGGSAWEYAPMVAAFREGLSEIGFFEDRNVLVEYRWAEGRYERLPTMAADLIRRQVAVMMVNGPAVLPAKAATTTIPIVFSTAVDPVELGIVASLNRPGGNVTGVTSLGSEVGPKRLELMHELVPTAVIVALVNPTYLGAAAQSRELLAAARTLGVQLHILNASADRDFDPVFAKLMELRAGALVIASDTFFTGRSQELAALALRHSVPAIYEFREFVVAGGLMSYSASVTDLYRRAGIYTGRILKGEKPADLPVQQSTRIELTINMKTAKTLGLTIPITLLGRADAVIE
jgi:putative ABC transport system substrate-binding protein